MTKRITGTNATTKSKAPVSSLPGGHSGVGGTKGGMNQKTPKMHVAPGKGKTC